MILDTKGDLGRSDKNLQRDLAGTPGVPRDSPRERAVRHPDAPIPLRGVPVPPAAHPQPVPRLRPFRQPLPDQFAHFRPPTRLQPLAASPRLAPASSASTLRPQRVLLDLPTRSAPICQLSPSAFVHSILQALSWE